MREETPVSQRQLIAAEFFEQAQLAPVQHLLDQQQKELDEVDVMPLLNFPAQ